MVTKGGKQASRKTAARKIGFLEVPFNEISSYSFIRSKLNT
ncbi:MAG: hypothetical protein Q8K59_01845 [Nitrosomonas sp.]|nr:hypothetical protein [Nitrosomonas sp.]MDP1949842.1 hypothetical protein [Nitrosomonas sp.]